MAHMERLSNFSRKERCGTSMTDARTVEFSGGRIVRVLRELGGWTAWRDEARDMPVHGAPLEGVLAEALGLDPANDGVPEEIIARRAELSRSLPKLLKSRLPPLFQSVLRAPRRRAVASLSSRRLSVEGGSAHA
jgi:hypothetical protein